MSNEPTADIFGMNANMGNKDNTAIQKNHAPCLSVCHKLGVLTRSIVRRLTPLECERLMGFPDNYTRIPYRGKPAEKCPDSPRYKACGNSWAINCAEWITRRINAYDILHGGGGITSYATMCSGVEAQSLALRAANIEARGVFFSEIEPFPCALLAHHYPEVPNLGDMTKIAFKDGVISNGTTNIIFDGQLSLLSGGTPCQDVSVAGKRAGMAEGSGTRSSLAFHFARLCRELRPQWVLWENVPGVLSSNGGRDFARFIDQIEDCGYSLAWRVLDCQFVRVDKWRRAIPQRRRRVWVVGCLGDDWRAPAEVLFEPQGLRGDNPPRRKTREEIAADARGCAERYDCDVERARADGADGSGAIGSLCAHDGRGFNGQDANDGKLVVANYKANLAGGDEQTAAVCGDHVSSPSDYTNLVTVANGAAFGARRIEDVTTPLTNDNNHVRGDTPLVIVNGVDFYNGAITGESAKTPNCAAADKDHTGGVIVRGQSFDEHYGFKTEETDASGIIVNGTSAGHHNGVVICNSNGGDVMPTISADEYKMSQKQKDTEGGYVISKLRNV